MISIVLGCGYGDEGKGACVDQLCQDRKTDLVVRFNGGHQAGHTVVRGDIKHVFSNFGAGTLQGVPTYWSSFCTIHPLGILNEYETLQVKKQKVNLYIDPLCPVVTPFDIAENRQAEKIKNHGSVGVGFGATIARQEAYFKLFAQDLLFPEIAEMKLRAIASRYYDYDLTDKTAILMIKDFLEDARYLVNLPGIRFGRPRALESSDSNIVFEGAQGILLDQDFGFFPHVTRSNTTSKNVFELCNQFNINGVDCNIYYITRAYSTRHGAGPLLNEDSDVSYIQKNPDETNIFNPWQKEFRYAPLNIDMLHYAVGCDDAFSAPTTNKFNISKTLWVTCADQVPISLPVIYNNEPEVIDISNLPRMCGFSSSRIRAKQ